MEHVNGFCLKHRFVLHEALKQRPKTAMLGQGRSKLATRPNLVYVYICSSNPRKPAAVAHPRKNSFSHWRGGGLIPPPSEGCRRSRTPAARGTALHLLAMIAAITLTRKGRDNVIAASTLRIAPSVGAAWQRTEAPLCMHYSWLYAHESYGLLQHGTDRKLLLACCGCRLNSR